MIRVLLVITRAEPGGAQVHVLELVRGLGQQVEFHVAVGDDGFLAAALRDRGVPVHVLPALQRDVAPGSDLRAVAALRRLVAVTRPHLVHTHSTKAGLLGRLAAYTHGVPTVHTAHAWSFSDGLPRSRKVVAVPLEAFAGRITDRFVVVSQADRDVALRHRVARDAQVRIVHNGVADVADRADPGAQIPPVVTMVARMAAPKEHVPLLRALAGIDAPFRVRFVGDGPERPRVEAAVRALGLGSRTELVGTCADVPHQLARSHIGTLVSYQEGFPLAVLEAMRAGLPVVASDVGGVREAVEPGITGFLVPRQDERALRGALARLITEPALRAKMGAAGRRAYEARFTAEKMVEGTRRVYEEVVERYSRSHVTATEPVATTS